MILGRQARNWLRRAIGADTDFEIAPLRGSTSSSVFLISIPHDLNSQKFVLRVLDNQNWLTQEPDLAEHEAAALREAHSAGLRGPRLLEYSGADVGFGAPVVLMTFLEGRIELQPQNFQQWLGELAKQLAAIHRHPASDFPWQFRSWVNRELLTPPSWSASPRIWERAVEMVLEPPPETAAVFIHRDYHPANVLWNGHSISGVVDWINACRGPAGVDVAHCRTNLALMFGPLVAERFLEIYCSVAGDFAYHPYWDIDSVLDMCLPAPEFYGPWQEFGLDVIAPGVLRERIDEHLQRILEWVEQLP